MLKAENRIMEIITKETNDGCYCYCHDLLNSSYFILFHQTAVGMYAPHILVLNVPNVGL